MFPHRGVFFGLMLLTLLAAGCSENAPTAENVGNDPTDNKAAPLLAPLLFAANNTSNSDSAKPSRHGLVTLDSASHDFGEIKQKMEFHHDFVLTNTAEVPIRIMGMKSSCSCTWSESNDNFVGSIIAPQQKIDFPVFINTGTLQDNATGKINIVYRYQSDEPKWAGEEKLTLEVSGTILPDYRIEPVDLSFGEIRALETQTAKKRFRVTPVQLESLEIKDIKSSSELYSVNILSSDKEGYEVEVTFDGSSLANSEQAAGHLVVETNSKTVPNGLVTLSATYLAPIAVEPADILISSDKEGTIQKKVQITSSVPSQIRKVDVGDSDLIRAEFDSISKSDKHLIVFSIDPCRGAEIDETITVEVVLFPPGRESIIQTIPVTVYRFYKGELP